MFFALSHDSLSLIGLMPRSDGLSLMVESDLWVMSDLMGTGTSTGLATTAKMNKLDKSKEVGGRDPATKEITKQPPTECLPTPGVS
jgi:hypothetical protein